MNPLGLELRERLGRQSDLETKIEEIRRFKQDRIKPLEKGYLEKTITLDSLMEKLCDIADCILIESYQLAIDHLRPIYGIPRIKDNDGNYLSGEFALVGLGKLGGRELHFGSDLDLIFIFNKSGETHGARNITNKEYFAKVTQRIINYLTLPTREGFAFQVDTELRPSGNAGTLVSALDPWVTYYHENAQIWEKQALLKARLIHATGQFSQSFQGLFRRLIFLSPFPDNLAKEIHHLRMRMQRELAKETSRRWHYKKGVGGITDIEFLVQFLQLKYGKVFDDLLKPDTLGALNALKKHQFVTSMDLDTLDAAYRFYRDLEIRLELEFQLKEGYLDPSQEIVDQIGLRLGYASGTAFIEQFAEYRKAVRKIYLSGLKITEN